MGMDRLPVDPHQLSKIPLQISDTTVKTYGRRMGKLMAILGKAVEQDVGGKMVYVNSRSWKNLESRVAEAKDKFLATAKKVHKMTITPAQASTLKEAMRSQISEEEITGLLKFIQEKLPSVQEGAVYYSKEQTGLARKRCEQGKGDPEGRYVGYRARVV